MAIRTVRLDDEGEKLLARIVSATGLSVSAAVTRGLRALADELASEARQTPYDIYKDLDAGPGRDAVPPATKAKRRVREAIRRKLGRR